MSRPKVYTSYFANLRNIPSNIEPIAISRYVKMFYTGKHEPIFSPSPELLNDYKTGNMDWKTYTDRYLTELSEREGLEDAIKSLANKEYVLLCYEGRDKNCHRHILGELLSEMGFDVEEL